MLPYDEINAFTMTVADAIEYAAEGRVAEGYACLLSGLQRAHAAEASHLLLSFRLSGARGRYLSGSDSPRRKP
jgi:hypothetical protein